MCDRQEELRSAIKDPVCLAANDALAACMAASGRDWTKCDNGTQHALSFCIRV